MLAQNSLSSRHRVLKIVYQQCAYTHAQPRSTGCCGGGQLTHAAIVGLDGGVWASSHGFPNVSAQEVSMIARSFDDQATLAQAGLFLGGVKYMVVAGEPGQVVRGRKTPAGGCTIKKTVSAMVIGIYTEGVQPGDVNMVVENLGDYLTEQGI